MTKPSDTSILFKYICILPALHILGHHLVFRLKIDFILAPRAFKNSILDISARTDIAFNSDHSIVTANLWVKLKAQPKNAPTTVVRFHQPTESQKQQYNDAIRHCFNASAESQHIYGVAKFVQTMKQAAERIFAS